METLSFWLIRYLNELGQLTESDIFTSTLWPVYLQSTWWSFKWEVIKEPHESQGKESCASFQALKIQLLIVGFVTFTCFSLTVLKVLVIYSDSTTSTTTTATSNSINNDHVHHDCMFSTLFLLANPLSCTTHVQISRAHTYSKTLHRGIFRSVKKSVSLLQTMVMFAMSSPYFFMFQLISCLCTNHKAQHRWCPLNPQYITSPLCKYKCLLLTVIVYRLLTWCNEKCFFFPLPPMDLFKCHTLNL